MINNKPEFLSAYIILLVTLGVGDTDNDPRAIAFRTFEKNIGIENIEWKNPWKVKSCQK